MEETTTAVPEVGGPAVGNIPPPSTNCETNQDCINSDTAFGDFCNNGVCGECEIGTTRVHDTRPVCVDQSGGVGIWACNVSEECPDETTCGTPSCAAFDNGNYCSLDHDADACFTTGGGTAGGQQAPEELDTCTSNDECIANEDGKDFCNGVCGECEIGTSRLDNQRPLCIDQGNGIAIWGCDDSSCTVEGTSCGSPSCVADIPYYCSDNHEAECN